MRELKFRAWDTERKTFYHELVGLFNNLSSNWRDFYEIQQYTGLKDKNGKEIYEGDIVHLEGHKHNHKIIYTVSSFVGKQTKGKFMGYLDGLFFYRTEVIGNIYENPELLERS